MAANDACEASITDRTASTCPAAITSRVHARIGLLGNPSDAYYGKAISFSLASYYAEVALLPQQAIEFVPHRLHDRVEFTNASEFLNTIQSEGYYGGVRLLMAMYKVFCAYCKDNGIALRDGGFRLTYETNIPRQVGLSGSSAIACAALNCLMEFYGIEDAIPVTRRPNLVLDAETDLGIAAGLQDRVVQVYGGLMYMDFSAVKEHPFGAGAYERIDAALLPPLWLVHCNDSRDSGKVHNPLRQRWLSGDARVHDLLRQVAECAQLGRDALLARDYARLAQLMDRNFDLRRELLGDAALGPLSLDLVLTCRSVGAAAKFTGSGGAALALCLGGMPQEVALRDVCLQKGYTLTRVSVGSPLVL